VPSEAREIEGSLSIVARGEDQRMKKRRRTEKDILENP
jgi:hypothetical protein